MEQFTLLGLTACDLQQFLEQVRCSLKSECKFVDKCDPVNASLRLKSTPLDFARPATVQGKLLSSVKLTCKFVDKSDLQHLNRHARL